MWSETCIKNNNKEKQKKIRFTKQVCACRKKYLKNLSKEMTSISGISVAMEILINHSKIDNCRVFELFDK